MVLIVEGLPYFTFPEKIKLYLMKVQGTSDTVLRIIGLVSVTIGLVLVYFGNN
jgi:hypothetical protein